MITPTVTRQGEFFHEYTLQGRVDAAVAMLREHATDTPYAGGFSGGKDSIVLKHLAHMAGVAVDWHYSVTQIDPPDLMRFIRAHYPDVEWLRTKEPFFHAVARKRMPTRRVRWCCALYKEHKTPQGKTLLLGIRAAESARRAKSWAEVGENRRGEFTVLPIFHWKDSEIWEFIRAENLPYCHLYDCGFRRLGCVGCPMAMPQHRAMEFAMYPKLEQAWKAACERAWQATDPNCKTKQRVKTWQQFWDVWMYDESMPPLQCGENPQLDLIEDVHNSGEGREEGT